MFLFFVSRFHNLSLCCLFSVQKESEAKADEEKPALSSSLSPGWLSNTSRTTGTWSKIQKYSDFDSTENTCLQKCSETILFSEGARPPLKTLDEWEQYLATEQINMLVIAPETSDSPVVIEDDEQEVPFPVAAAEPSPVPAAVNETQGEPSPVPSAVNVAQEQQPPAATGNVAQRQPSPVLAAANEAQGQPSPVPAQGNGVQGRPSSAPATANEARHPPVPLIGHEAQLRPSSVPATAHKASVSSAALEERPAPVPLAATSEAQADAPNLPSVQPSVAVQGTVTVEALQMESQSEIAPRTQATHSEAQVNVPNLTTPQRDVPVLGTEQDLDRENGSEMNPGAQAARRLSCLGVSAANPAAGVETLAPPPPPPAAHSLPRVPDTTAAHNPPNVLTARTAAPVLTHSEKIVSHTAPPHSVQFASSHTPTVGHSLQEFLHDRPAESSTPGSSADQPLPNLGDLETDPFLTGESDHPNSSLTVNLVKQERLPVNMGTRVVPLAGAELSKDEPQEI